MRSLENRRNKDIASRALHLYNIGYGAAEASLALYADMRRETQILMLGE